MLSSLKEIYEMLEQINQKVFAKEDLLKEYLKDPVFGKILEKVLNYIACKEYKFQFKQINFCVYFNDPIAIENQNTDGIFEMLDYLINKSDEISEEEISFLEKISSSNIETIEVVTRIINKYSGCGISNQRLCEILRENSGDTYE
jgi:hypothetical protein